MIQHHITAIHDPDGAETEVRIYFVYHRYQPERGPSYASGGEPAEPGSVEFDCVKRWMAGDPSRWVEDRSLWEWAEAYLQGDGLDDALTTAADDDIAAREYAAEMRAESWRE